MLELYKLHDNICKHDIKPLGVVGLENLLNIIPLTIMDLIAWKRHKMYYLYVIAIGTKCIVSEGSECLENKVAYKHMEKADDNYFHDKDQWQ